MSPKNVEYQTPELDRRQIEIRVRANKASSKVRERVEKFIDFVNRIDKESALCQLKKIIRQIRQEMLNKGCLKPQHDPDHPHYESWSSEEVTELYSVLSGEITA